MLAPYKVFYRDLLRIPEYTSLLRNLLQRDLHLKYRSSVMGYFWSLLNPLAMVLVFVFAFKYVMRPVAASSVDYVCFLVVGLIFWNLFASVSSTTTGSILNNGSLISKIFFPRVLAVLADQIFAVAEHVLVYPFVLVLLLYYHTPLTWNILYFIPLFLLLNLFLFGIALTLATMNVFFRDTSHFVAITLQFMFWLTPITYPISTVPQNLAPIIKIMPMSPFIRCLQNIFCDGNPPPYYSFLQAAVYSVVALLVGVAIFYRYQRNFVEEL